MNDLINAIQEQKEFHEDPNWTDTHPLQVAASSWANHCINTYDGKILKKGLAISQAIGNFTSELLRTNPTVYEADCQKKSNDSDESL